MNIKDTKRLDRKLLLLLLLASLATLAPAASAQVIVSDPVTEDATTSSFAGELGEYAETADRYMRQVEEYQKQLERYTSTISDLTSLTENLNSLGLPSGQKLEKVDESAGVASACNISTGITDLFSFQNLTKALGIGEESGLDEQKTICAMRVTMQNRKYNESVDFMNETMPSIQNTMKELIASIKGKGETPGAQDQHQTDTPAIDADTQKKIEEFRSRQDQYNALISALNDRQVILAQQLMRGKSKSITGEVIGVVVQSAALEAALHYNK